MATATERKADLDRQAFENQALIDRTPAGTTRDKLIEKQRSLNEQRNALKGTVRIEQDIEAGKQMGQQFIPTGSLGRLDTSLDRVQAGQLSSTQLGRATAGQVGTTLGRATAEGVSTQLGRVDEAGIRQGRSAEVGDILELRRQALQGLSGEEQRVRRDQALQEIGRAEQLQSRQIQAAQAGAGVRGATASAQQLLALQGGQQARANFERDLFLANQEAKTQALNAYEQSVGLAEQSEFQRQAARAELQQFNLAQQLRERELQQYNIGQRSQAQQINLQQQLSERQLQQFNIGQQAQTQQFNLAQQLQERGLEQFNISQQQRAQEVNLAQQQAEKQLQQFNLQQAAQERFGQLSTALGFAQLSQADIGGQRAIEAQRAAAQTASGGGK